MYTVHRDFTVPWRSLFAGDFIVLWIIYCQHETSLSDEYLLSVGYFTVSWKFHCYLDTSLSDLYFTIGWTLHRLPDTSLSADIINNKL